MLKGKKVLLRPMKPNDILRQYEFGQDIELYGLENTYPHVTPAERAQLFYESRTQPNEDTAPFAIEADGKYIGHCALKHLQDRHGSFELEITIGDRAYWGQGCGRDAVKLLLFYAFHYLGGRRILATTHALNERAIRCFLACGFLEEGRARRAVWVEGQYMDLVNLSILMDEWQRFVGEETRS